MKASKIFLCGLAALLAVGMTACGGGDVDTDKTPGKEQNQNISAASEDDFIWNGDKITYLTESGTQKKTLVIPSRCQGFDGTLYLTSVTEAVIFEGSHDIDIGMQFCDQEALERIELPSGLTMIPEMAFSGCYALNNVDIPAAVTEIGDYAFEKNTALRSVSFSGNELVNIGAGAFIGCSNLTQIILPDSVEVIGKKAFAETSIESFTLPTSVKVIGDGAFFDIGLKDLYIPEEVVLENIGSDSFANPMDPTTIHVVEGSWADLHFDELFPYSCTKSYQ